MMKLLRCCECLMPATRPDLEFLNGVCSACIAFKRRAEIDWDQRKETLIKIIESAKPNRDGYTTIVPSSGGKDSTAQVLTLIELGAKPLIVTASTCMLTAIGRANIDNLARYATTIEVTPNRRVRSMLNRLGLELVGDCSWPEHISIFATPWRIARDMNIPLIFYGEAPTTEYAGPLDQVGADRMTRRWITEFGGHLGLRADDMIGNSGLTAIDMAPYQMPTADEMVGIDAYFLGAFIPWNSHKNAQKAIAAGMIAELPGDTNWWAAENLDCAITGIHDFFGALKYGYGRFCAQISVDIRYGMISRQEAAELVKEQDCGFPYVYMGVPFDDALDQIEMTKERFFELCSEYANSDIWDLANGSARRLPRLKPDVWAVSFA